MSKKNDSIYKVIFGVLAIIIVILGIVIVKNKMGDNGEYKEVVGEHEHEHEYVDEDDDDGEIVPENHNHKIFGSGDFVLSGPQVYIVEDVKNTYEEFKLEKNIDEVITKVGEPIKVLKGKMLSGYTFRLKDGNATLKVTVDNKTNKITEKCLIIFSRMDTNIKLSSELGADIAYLPEKAEQLSVGMKFEDVEKILGDKYLEIEETARGYKCYAWFDIFENRIDIWFNENNEIHEMTDVLGEQ